MARVVCFAVLVPGCTAGRSPLDAKRILFLGDSITYSGQYVAWIETQARLHGIDPLPQFINAGLPSETCSGLSEPDHPFARPDVHERLARALARVSPDVVVAAYGMNDGIYHPFSEERFASFQSGINRLIDTVHASGARLVLLTPPPFDALPASQSGVLKAAGAETYAYDAIYEHYDDVLKRYAAWIVEQADRVEMVIDLHTPVLSYLQEQRRGDSGFTLSRDGIHPNAEGHRLLGGIIARAWGVESTVEPPATLLDLVQQKADLLRDAWLTEIGHERPGVQPGLPMAEATAQAGRLEARIQALLRARHETAISGRGAPDRVGRTSASGDQRPSQ